MGLDGATSLSGFKSWLRQNLYLVPEKQLLTLSVIPEVQSGSTEVIAAMETPIVESQKFPMKGNREGVPHKSIETFTQRTSQYHGVIRYRWTGRYEAYLWDNSCRKEGQTRKESQEEATEAYDIVVIKFCGLNAVTNFDTYKYGVKLICFYGERSDGGQGNMNWIGMPMRSAGFSVVHKLPMFALWND